MGTQHTNNVAVTVSSDSEVSAYITQVDLQEDYSNVWSIATIIPYTKQEYHIRSKSHKTNLVLL